MVIDAVAITTTNMKKSIQFYSELGFDFSNSDHQQDHVEPKTPDGSARLMIDNVEIVKDIIKEDPKPGNHSPFAIRYNSPCEVDDIVTKVKAGGFKVVQEPWDAFWNQRYSVVEDPDGYRIDIYADLE